MNIEAVVINCSTREQTTLALVSAIRHAQMPVTVIDCESTDGSYEFFTALRSRLAFKLAAMPLSRHGDTLDRIFANTGCDAVLLLDSDAEILRDDLVPSMIAALDAKSYGSGFLHAGQWLGANHLSPRQVGYYAPRMWIPCVMLKVAPVKAALARGRTFRERIVGNEIPQWPWLSQLLCLRFRVPLLRAPELDCLRSWRRARFGVRPHYFYYDTGAALHEHLQDEQGLALAHLGGDLWASAVRHYHGVTRKQLRRRMRNAADVESTRREAVDRIESVYGIEVPELRAGVTAARTAIS